LCRMRRDQEIHCTIAYLGGYPQTDEQASQNVKSYLDSIKALSQQKLGASITVKPTTLGAILNKTRCTEHILTVLREAKTHQVGFELATEGKDLVQYAVETAVTCAKERHDVTIALQAYLDRTIEDLKITLSNRIRPRLVKGAYLGDTRDFAEIQGRFRKLAMIMLKNKHHILVGTHDSELIEWIMQRMNSNKQLVEFGFLKGLAEKTKVDLAKQGWKVLEYVPFGKNVEAYESRRWRFLRELGHLQRVPAP
jgi:proline dehydrogenase